MSGTKGMRKVVKEICAYLSMTVDGYIADKYKSVDFLHEVDGEGDNGFSDFYNGVDLVVMGGNTFRWLLDSGVQENPYNDKRVIVISSEKVNIDWDIEFYEDNLENLNKIFSDYKRVWIVGGGQLISSMLNKKMINRLYVTLTPFILSDGVPLFNNVNQRIKLNLLDVKQFNQFVEVNYEVEYLDY